MLYTERSSLLTFGCKDRKFCFVSIRKRIKMWFLQKMCMLCFKDNIQLKNINTKDASNVSVIEKLIFTITDMDNNVKDCRLFICEHCENVLNVVFVYKKQCLKQFSYIRKYIQQLNSTHLITSDLAIDFDMNTEPELDNSNSPNKLDLATTETVENVINLEDLNTNFKFVKDEHEISIDYDLFEGQIKNSDLVKNEIDMEEYLAERSSEENIPNMETDTNNDTNENDNTDIHTKDIKTEINTDDYIEIYTDFFEENTENQSRQQFLKCDFCQNQFKTKRGLNIHMNVHKEKQSYICKFCHKVFKYYSFLKRHMKVHSSERPFKCNTCVKSFCHLCSLKRHMLTHMKKAMEQNT